LITISQCDEKTITRIAVALGKVAIGHPISFVFEEGVHRIEDEGKVFEQPNGTATLRIFINGGAQDSGVPERTADDRSAVLGGDRVGDEPVATLHPSVAQNGD
jgi:hypothetical protein